MTTDRNITEKASRSISFGIVDDKGREMGVSVTTFTAEHTPSAMDGCGYTLAAGTWYCAWTKATRNGNGFGPSTGEIHARTPKERDTLLAKRIEGARARYVKQYLRTLAS